MGGTPKWEEAIREIRTEHEALVSLVHDVKVEHHSFRKQLLDLQGEMKAMNIRKTYGRSNEFKDVRDSLLEDLVDNMKEMMSTIQTLKEEDY